MRRIAFLIIACILLAGCKPVKAWYSAIAPLSLTYDPNPDNPVLFADVQAYPGAPEPGKECLRAFRPRLRVWGDGLVYLNIASANQSPPFLYAGHFDPEQISGLLRFLKAGGFFNSWDPGYLNPAGTWFRMGANLKSAQFQYQGGDLDPPLYHELVHENILPFLTPLDESGQQDGRIEAILRESEACYSQIRERGAADPTPMPPVPYPLGSLRQVYPPPAPYPIGTPDATEAARIAEKGTQVAIAVMTLTAEPSSTPLPTLSAAQKTASLDEMKRMIKSTGAIMLQDNSKTFTYTLGERFFVFLDDEKNPRDELVCEPQPLIGYISNGDFRGPDLYPAYYEAEQTGSCTLKDRDFAVKIVVNALPTVQP